MSLGKSALTSPRASWAFIGGGSSASAMLAATARHSRVLRTYADTDFNVVHFSPPGLWRNMKPSIQMGQSSQTLVAPEYQRKFGTRDKFMLVEDYNKYTEKRDKDSLTELGGASVNSRVLSVRKFDKNVFAIEYVMPDSSAIRTLEARNVVFAPGAGSERSILSGVERQRRASGKPRSYPEYVTSSDVLSGANRLIGRAKGGFAGLVGDGATSAWVANELLKLGIGVVWIAQPGARAFDNANPGGRNTEIMKLTDGMRFTGSAHAIEELGFDVRDDPKKPGLVLHCDNYQRHGSPGYGRSMELPLSMIVSAMGAAGPALAPLHSSIIHDLRPIMDIRGSRTGAPAGIGYRSSDDDLFVIGAGAYYLGTQSGLKQEFDEPGLLLAQPPPGIAAIEMGANLLSDKILLMQYNALRDFHPQTAHKLEIAGHFMNLGVDPRGADEMAVKVMDQRTERTAKQGEFSNRAFSEAALDLLKGKSPKSVT